MNYAHIEVIGNTLSVTPQMALTTGVVGGRVALTFDGGWESRHKTLIWRGSGLTVTDPHCTGIIPAEVLTKPNGQLILGIYGTEGETATPTLWCEVGQILPGADPSGDPAADPQLPMWAVLKQDMGDVSAALDSILAMQNELIGGDGA